MIKSDFEMRVIFSSVVLPVPSPFWNKKINKEKLKPLVYVVVDLD